jgi:hypothetical protein
LPIIQDLRAAGVHDLSTATNDPPFKIDVNNDLRASLHDVLNVVRELRKQLLGEAEPSADAHFLALDLAFAEGEDSGSLWHNHDLPGDVNRDGRCGLDDVLEIIRELRKEGPHRLDPPEPPMENAPMLVDADNDWLLDLGDVLTVIQELRHLAMQPTSSNS